MLLACFRHHWPIGQSESEPQEEIREIGPALPSRFGKWVCREGGNTILRVFQVEIIPISNFRPNSKVLVNSSYCLVCQILQMYDELLFSCDAGNRRYRTLSFHTRFIDYVNTPWHCSCCDKLCDWECGVYGTISHQAVWRGRELVGRKQSE